jgi:hypothetical protein
MRRQGRQVIRKSFGFDLTKAPAFTSVGLLGSSRCAAVGTIKVDHSSAGTPTPRGMEPKTGIACERVLRQYLYCT